MKKLTFNPTISFDGVAIILACIGASLWFGAMRETIQAHGQQLRDHARVLQSLADGQQLQSQNIAVLQALINERTKATQKP
jgi:hypothetical protein